MIGGQESVIANQRSSYSSCTKWHLKLISDSDRLFTTYKCLFRADLCKNYFFNQKFKCLEESLVPDENRVS